MVKLVVSLEKNNECDCWRKAVPFEPHEKRLSVVAVILAVIFLATRARKSQSKH